MASSDQKASAGVYVTPDVGLEVTDGTYSRVQVGKITTTPTYGIKVLSSDGSTVIIDGTSDMFRIVAHGSITGSYPNNGFVTFHNVQLPSLGTYSAPPMAMLSCTMDNSALANVRGITLDAKWGALPAWIQQALGEVFIDGSSFVNASLGTYNATGGNPPPQTAACEYYILAQAAI